MTRKYLKYTVISVVIILTIYFLTENWLNPDPKGIGHALVYLFGGLLLSFIGTIVIVISFFKKTNWLTFVNVLFGLLNSLFIIVFANCLGADWSLMFLIGYTSLTGIILTALTIKQIYADAKTPVTT